MKIGRLVKTAVKYAPIAYPIIRKMMKNRKKGGVDVNQQRPSGQPRRK
ncbi:hypothetical protein [Planomicrobium sp. YIM 101495]|nr:hypothetical protein [Planomicrobium sp. YIM 101495]